MTKGDTVQVTPSDYTLLGRRVTTPDSISARHTDTMQPMISTPNSPMEDDMVVEFWGLPP